MINDSNIGYTELRSKYRNIFIQPGMAFTNKFMSTAFDLRMNMVNMYEFASDEPEWWANRFLFHPDKEENFLLLEPTFTLTAGGKNVKGVFQAGFTVPAINEDAYYKANSDILLNLFKLSLGINFRL
ncbi:MAG: hypothetical protein HC906_10760 [Bacteroidales bacterium]|nr:hypothetical protein [Bacteroidales bacterium]